MYLMKTIIGVFILVMLLAAAGGCTTQQAKPAVTATTITTTTVVTEVPTEISTPKPTALPTTILTTSATPETTSSVSATKTPWSSATFSSTRKLEIHIRDNKFEPDSLTVLPGTMVTWVNDDNRVHIVKATGDSAGKFTSAELMKGAQFNYDFGEKTGIFEFTDPGYPEMIGAIIVRKGDTLWSAENKPSS